MADESERTSPTGRDGLLEASIDYFAENGIGDVSLRQLAAAIGSSHRMLIYHFGSREGLLTAVVEALEAGEKQILLDMLADDQTDPRVLAWRFWTHVADVGDFYGPLYYELASHAMRTDDPYGPLRIPNVEMWVDALMELWAGRGRPQEFGSSESEARAHSRLNLAVARGLLHDLLLTKDRDHVDEAMARFDFLSFGTPHPNPSVARLTHGWGPTAMSTAWPHA
jgi:AcrR family transcriptional regulator